MRCFDRVLACCFYNVAGTYLFVVLGRGDGWCIGHVGLLVGMGRWRRDAQGAGELDLRGLVEPWLKELLLKSCPLRQRKMRFGKDLYMDGISRQDADLGQAQRTRILHFAR
jgi:hypothetical protein